MKGFASSLRRSNSFFSRPLLSARRQTARKIPGWASPSPASLRCRRRRVKDPCTKRSRHFRSTQAYLAKLTAAPPPCRTFRPPPRACSRRNPARPWSAARGRRSSPALLSEGEDLTVTDAHADVRHRPITAPVIQRASSGGREEIDERLFFAGQAVLAPMRPQPAWLNIGHQAHHEIVFCTDFRAEKRVHVWTSLFCRFRSLLSRLLTNVADTPQRWAISFCKRPSSLLPLPATTHWLPSSEAQAPTVLWRARGHRGGEGRGA